MSGHWIGIAMVLYWLPSAMTALLGFGKRMDIWLLLWVNISGLFLLSNGTKGETIYFPPAWIRLLSFGTPLLTSQKRFIMWIISRGVRNRNLLVGAILHINRSNKPWLTLIIKKKRIPNNEIVDPSVEIIFQVV